MQLFPGRTAYLLIIAVALVDAVWIAASPITLPLHQLQPPIQLCVLFGLIAFAISRFMPMAGRFEEPLLRVGYFLQGLIFLQIAWIAMRLFNHLSMSSAFPYADDLLVRWDAAIGANWHAYFSFVQNHGTVRWLMDHSYTSLTFLSAIAFLVLIVQKDLRRARYFLETFLVTAIVCTTIGMFFPAKAAVATYFGDVGALPNFASLPGVYHLESLERLRAAAPLTLNLSELPGLVTFPSFHTAAGILLVVSFWRTALFPVSLAYSTVMIGSTPVFGGHYFVDLIAGAAVALAIAYAFATRPLYRDLFSRGGAAMAQPEPRPSELSASG